MCHVRYSFRNLHLSRTPVTGRAERSFRSQFCYIPTMANRGQSRASLLISLRSVFEARGFDGATLSQLAAASGLSKASLYHHFPGGKGEMAAALLRESVAELERLAFSRLNTAQPAHTRLRRFVGGFEEYIDLSNGDCLVRVLAEGSMAAEHGDTIRQQYGDWLNRLAATFAETGVKRKRAERLATELLSGLYGNLAMARLLDRPALLSKHIRRLKKQFSI
jgi:AcrR family transcriptional regulator